MYLVWKYRTVLIYPHEKSVLVAQAYKWCQDVTRLTPTPAVWLPALSPQSTFLGHSCAQAAAKWAHCHTSQCRWWWGSRKAELCCFTGFPLKLYMAYFHKYNFIKLISSDNPGLNSFIKAITSFWNYFPNFSTERNPQSISDSALGYLPGSLSKAHSSNSSVASSWVLSGPCWVVATHLLLPLARPWASWGGNPNCLQ